MITVITPTLPSRGKLLAEAAESVARQTLAPAEWLIRFDHDGAGPIKVVNELAGMVGTPWLFRLDDDDLLEADHFETLQPYLTDDVDIVYSWCSVEGDGVHKAKYQREFSARDLGDANFIPASACIRTDLWHQLNGYQPSDWTKHEDWDFWVRAVRAGARFRCVPIVTWRYRLSGDWAHRSA